MLNVQIALFDGFDLLDAIAPYEVFCAAGMFADGAVQAELVAAEGARTVTSGVGGVRMEATAKLDPSRPGIILVPGASGELLGDGLEAIPAILARAAGTELIALMEQAIGNPAITVATVCGGSLLLAMGGLVEGRPAVTHHMGMEVLGATGARPIQARVVDDGDFVSGGGVTSGLDVAIHLVERELGPSVALAVEQLFEFERRGTAWKSGGMTPKASGAAEAAAASEVQVREGLPVAVARNGGGGSAFDGEWEATIATPVGKMNVLFRIETALGVVRGTAAQGDEFSELIDPVLTGGTLRWSQRITKPMRLNLTFEARVDGDHMTGTAKAGVLPASKLSGRRVK
ncbi:DJ-1/PfpI family protein [Paenibacillus methanolicus]|uniref:DJ-1/PfpI family protein n=1 Tax=Paenibacillus methanolicus TaxID=582686 RepID=A0A5S5C4I7_9BACL|nr:DJ-1/PfpI family protein [Paenibacillus methanolicus]TYP73392.1 DJ-1/PfpI family protein [Paenibacillus methanolicus]